MQTNGGKKKGQIQILKASIISLKTDALVNAASETLKEGPGVCGAIFRAAGAQIREACEAAGGCKTGSAVITLGFQLKSRFIIHAVGPRWIDGNQGEPKLLRSAYTQSLKLAVENGCKSIGFPLISAGSFGYPVDKAWQEAIRACLDFRKANPGADLDIQFAVIDGKVQEIGQKILKDLSRERTTCFLEMLDEDGLKTIRDKLVRYSDLLVDRKAHPMAAGLLDLLCEPEIMDNLSLEQIVKIAEAIFPEYVREEAWIERYCDILQRIVDEANKRKPDSRALVYEKHMRDILIPALKKGAHTGDIWDDLEPLEDIYKVTACLLRCYAGREPFVFDVDEVSLGKLAETIRNPKGGGNQILGIVSIPMKTEDRQYAIFLSWILEELLRNQEGLKVRDE